MKFKVKTIGINPTEAELNEALDEIKSINKPKKKLLALKSFAKILFEFYQADLINFNMAKYFFIMARLEASKHSKRFKINPY